MPKSFINEVTLSGPGKSKLWVVMSKQGKAPTASLRVESNGLCLEIPLENVERDLVRLLDLSGECLHYYHEQEEPDETGTHQTDATSNGIAGNGIDSPREL